MECRATPRLAGERRPVDQPTKTGRVSASGYIHLHQETESAFGPGSTRLFGSRGSGFFFDLILGTRTRHMPEKFHESETEETAPPGVPTFGMSLVAGGRTIDAGSLPPPPIPIVTPL